MRVMGVDAMNAPGHHAEDVPTRPGLDTKVLATIQWNMTEELDSIVAIATLLHAAGLLPDAAALCSGACLGVALHVEALGLTLMTMSVAAVVARLEGARAIAR
jgi:hypothetical protein